MGVTTSQVLTPRLRPQNFIYVMIEHSMFTLDIDYIHSLNLTPDRIEKDKTEILYILNRLLSHICVSQEKIWLFEVRRKNITDPSALVEHLRKCIPCAAVEYLPLTHSRTDNIRISL